jgi:hypothetical protein
MAAPFESVLKTWRPQMKSTTLLGKGDGRDKANVTAFCDAAVGHAKTFTFIETENGNSICGGFLAPAWKEDQNLFDPSLESFMFTLKNHLLRGRVGARGEDLRRGRRERNLPRGAVGGLGNGVMFVLAQIERDARIVGQVFGGVEIHACREEGNCVLAELA